MPRSGAVDGATMPCGPDTFDVEIICGECRFLMPLSEERARYCGIDLDKREIVAAGVRLDLDGVTFDLPRGRLRVPEPNGVPWKTLWQALCELAGVPTNVAVNDPSVIQALLEDATRFSARHSLPRRKKGHPRGIVRSNDKLDLILHAIRAAPEHRKGKSGKRNLAKGIECALGARGEGAQSDPETLRRAINRWLRSTS